MQVTKPITTRAFFVCLVFVLTGFLGACATPQAENRQALWDIVQEQCVPHQLQSGDPSPCVKADLARGMDEGFVIFPDRNGVAQFLLLPTRKIAGIESPELQKAASPNYWREAWQARRYVSGKLHRTLPPDAIGLAVNSADARSQDQLHIHIDCMKPRVRDTLRIYAREIGPEWRTFSVPLEGKFYRAKRFSSLDNINLFAQLTDDLAISPDALAHETLVVTGDGVQPHDGFIVLEDHTDITRDDRAHGEDLLDPTCRLAAE